MSHLNLSTKRYSSDLEGVDEVLSEITNNKIYGKTIIDYQNEVKEYQKRERGFLVQLHLKEKELRHLDNQLKEERKKAQDQNSRTDCYLDPLLLNEFKILKNLLKEKKEKLLLKEQELFSLTFKSLYAKATELLGENKELYELMQGGVLENMKLENGLEKSQIDQLMFKLKEKESINNELEIELNEVNETINLERKKNKELEEKIEMLEKEIKSLKSKYRD